MFRPDYTGIGQSHGSEGERAMTGRVNCESLRNSSLPSGNRGHQSRDPGWQSGSRWFVPGSSRLVRGIEVAAEGGRRKPPERNPGGEWKQTGGRLGFERISALPIIALGGCDTELHLFAERAANESSDRMRLPFRGFHDLLHRSPAGALQQFQNLSGLAALASRSRLLRLLSAFEC